MMNKERLLLARVLVELGELAEAERELRAGEGQDLDLLSLLAKIKHMRGELSQAIPIWAQIRAQSTHGERALTALGAILHLAADPHRGASDFVPTGPGAIAKKTPLHRALEKPFREFLAHRPDEARATCEELARTARGTDPDLYKLAMLANAWIAELSGDLGGACGVLERLASVRGFEADVDRMLGLARIYERIGTPDRLAGAARIQGYLERRFGKMSALGRLAALHRRLGQSELAEEYERRHLVAFRERMHRVSRADVACAAALRYFPLERLVRLALPIEEPRDLAPRARAIDAVLSGDFASARDLFHQGGERLDTMYLADLLAVEGDVAAASRALLAIVREDPRDPQALAALLHAYASAPSPEVEDALAQTPLYDHAESALRGWLAETPLRARPWRSTAILRKIKGEHTEAARAAERAKALEDASGRDSRATGRVLAAAVLHFPGKTKGLIHQIWADRRPAAAPGRGGFLRDEDILGNIAPDMKQGIRNTFFAVREYARSRFPEHTRDILDWEYTYKITKEDEPSGGTSAGLPSAVALLSVFLQVPVPQDVAFTGVVVADAHDALAVRRVGDVDEKVRGAYARNLRKIVLPADNRADLAASCAIPLAVEDEVVLYAQTLDEALALVFGPDLWL
jgi:hypothetical protein